MRIDYAAHARALVGARYRAQGRGEGGLDCVGLVLAAFELPVSAAPRDYRLSGNHGEAIHTALLAHFRRVSRRELRSGDVMLLQPAGRQYHLAVRTDDGFVHAHANIRRVVETPGEPTWPLLAVYRKRRSR